MLASSQLNLRCLACDRGRSLRVFSLEPYCSRTLSYCALVSASKTSFAPVSSNFETTPTLLEASKTCSVKLLYEGEILTAV